MKYVYETIEDLGSLKWIIFIPLLAGIVRGLVNALIGNCRIETGIRNEEREIEDNAKDLDIDEDLKKYFDYKE